MSPYELIDPLWGGRSTVTLRTKQLQDVMLYYGGSYLHLKNGQGYYLKNKRVAPGVYDLWLEPSK